MRLLIDTFNSGLREATGIGTYTRVLTHVNHHLGHEVLLLTDAPIPTGTGVPDSVLLFDHQDSRRQAIKVPWYIKNRFFSVRQLARRLSGVSVRQLDLMDHNPTEHRLGHFNGIMNSFDLFRTALDHFSRTRQPTVIELPSDVDIAHFTWCLPIRIRNAKHNIYTLHDLIPLSFPHLTLENKSVYFDLVTWCCRTADRILTVSEHSRHEIIGLLGVPAEKVVNTFQALGPVSDMHSKLQTDDIKSALQALFGLSYAEYFLMAGLIEPRKNIARAIEAHLTAVTNFPLIICGPQNELSKSELTLFESLRSHGPQRSARKKILILGYISRDLLTMLTAGARAVLVPSITEGFGLSALEAMSLGTPVIASTGGALPEVCGDAAIYIDPYDTMGLRRAIDRVATLAEPELAEFKSKSISQAGRFSLNTYCSRLHDVYSSLQSRSGNL
jgi:glycosyltransferase involved in cell wall biosynthesis